MLHGLLSILHMLQIFKTDKSQFEQIRASRTAMVGKKGSCINFVTVDEKLRFQLNQQAIETSNYGWCIIKNGYINLGISY